MSRGPLPPPLETALLAVLGVVAVLAALLPLGPGGLLVPPDLLYCLVIAWVVRRPASAPLALVLALGLFADAMLSRPLGLGALALMLVSEAARAQRARLTGTPFVLEWLAAAAGFAAGLAGSALVLTLAFADAPGLQPSLAWLAATALAYPLVVAGLVFGLRLRGPRAVAMGNPLGRLG